MAGIKYTKEQIEELLKNKYVRGCSQKYITFTDEFKIKGLELNKKGVHHKEIFKDLGFPEYIINSEIPKDTFDRLRYKSKHKGVLGIKGRPKKDYSTHGGGKIDFDTMTKDEYIEFLETKLAVFEELKKYTGGNFP